MSVIAYIRVSSKKQTVQHQKYEIGQFAKQNNLKIDQWVNETASSRKPLHKRELGNLLCNLNADDVLLSCEISRLGRSLLEVMKILETCLNKDCQVWTIKENYRLGNDIQSKVMAFAFGLAAEIERNLISQRTKASLDSIRARGKKLGRPLSPQSEMLKTSENKKQVRKLLDLGIPKDRIARIMQVPKITLHRFVKRMNWNKKTIHQNYNS